MQSYILQSVRQYLPTRVVADYVETDWTALLASSQVSPVVVPARALRDRFTSHALTYKHGVLVILLPGLYRTTFVEPEQFAERCSANIIVVEAVSAYRVVFAVK